MNNKICTTKAKEMIQTSKGKMFGCHWQKVDDTYRSMVARIDVTKFSNGGTLKYNPKEYDLILLIDMNLAKKFKHNILDENGKVRKPYVMLKYKNLKTLTYKGIAHNVVKCTYDIKENESNIGFGGCFSCEKHHHKTP